MMLLMLIHVCHSSKCSLTCLIINVLALTVFNTVVVGECVVNLFSQRLILSTGIHRLFHRKCMLCHHGELTGNQG